MWKTSLFLAKFEWFSPRSFLLIPLLIYATSNSPFEVSFFSLTLASFKSLKLTLKITAQTQVLGSISVLPSPLASATQFLFIVCIKQVTVAFGIQITV